MDREPEKSPWEDFKPLGREEAPRPRRAPWHVWLMLTILLTALGAGLGVAGTWWVKSGGLAGTRRARERAMQKPVSAEEFRQMTQWGALAGGALGLLTGGVIWGRNLFGRDSENF